ncbi:CBS domain-containing protein CBSX5-like [Humulus lupulus]|uniref:CBS domain-containing protein CBSX5-like n=1 Tax=Humulus lupulus TaxID=3486 RepID=UPI002B4072D1|nr:CBS domain-containing protein CBSX5-like [Humulus lupulus]
MAVSLLAREASDLCLGKPALRSLSATATVTEALSAFKRFRETFLSVWTATDQSNAAAAAAADDCLFCIGKVCMVDVICFLCKDENLASPAQALQSPVSVLIPKIPGLVRHLEPNARLSEAFDLILEGAQNLIIPIQSSRKKLHQKPASFNSSRPNNREYCWVTQEDIIRYLLNCIGLFSPTPANPINSLNLIDDQNILAVHYDDPASAALPLISQSLISQTSVAVIDGEGKLVGEISPSTLNFCDETVAAAIATLSASDLMAYIDYGGPPEDLVQLVKDRLEEKNFRALLEFMDEDSTSSSDDEFGYGKSGRLTVRSSEAIVCYSWSSLVAVMIQALAHRLNYVWVVEQDGTLVGIVTFAAMLKVFRERLNTMP